MLRSRDLAAQIAELTEDLEELRSENARLLERFSYEDASAPAAFRREIAAMENTLKKLTVQEKKSSGELEKAIAEYRNLKAQTADSTIVHQSVGLYERMRDKGMDYHHICLVMDTREAHYESGWQKYFAEAVTYLFSRDNSVVLPPERPQKRG